MKNYLFINLYDEFLSDLAINELNQHHDIHINFPQNISHSIIWYQNLFQQINNAITKEQSIFIYAFNDDCVLAAQNYNFNIHYCFINENINLKNNFQQLMNKDNTAEVFWILDEKILNHDLTQCINWLNQLNRAICPNINGNLIDSLMISNHEEVRTYIFNLHKKFNNSLYLKEVNLPVGSWLFNEAIIQKDYLIEKNNIVLGITGDFLVIDNNIDALNLKTLMRNKDCVGCEFFNSCKERGIGYIMNKLKLKGCNSYNILKYE